MCFSIVFCVSPAEHKGREMLRLFVWNCPGGGLDGKFELELDPGACICIKDAYMHTYVRIYTCIHVYMHV